MSANFGPVFASLAIAATSMICAPAALAQGSAEAAPASAPVYVPTSLEPEPGLPRTPSGHPDFQGAVWTTNFFPVFESNPMSDTLIVSEEKAAEMLQMFVGGFLSSDNPNLIDAEAHTLIGGTDGLPIVRGERRAWLVVLPADGKLPLTEAARKELQTTDPMEAPMDGPEQRPLAERCLVQEAAPPNASTLATHFIRFIQTDSFVVIQGEYGDEARIIPFTDKHGVEGMQSLFGDSIARWDGDTLVIETTGAPPALRVRILPSIIVSEDATVVERYTRLSRDELLYQYTVIDPNVYTAPWLAEHSLVRSDQRMYPHACHEGNYSLPNILKGARQAEVRARAGK